MRRAAATAHWRAAGHQYPQHVIAALARWLKPENRCLVPANRFAEYAPDPNPETKKKDVVVWFAVNDDLRCSALLARSSRCPFSRAAGSASGHPSGSARRRAASGCCYRAASVLACRAESLRAISIKECPPA